MCPHTPPCPAPSAPGHEAAHTIVNHPEQGWSLLCNGVVIFEDTGELLPGGAFIAPHRPTDLAAFDRPASVAPGHSRRAPAALSLIGDISQSHPRCLAYCGPCGDPPLAVGCQTSLVSYLALPATSLTGTPRRDRTALRVRPGSRPLQWRAGPLAR